MKRILFRLVSLAAILTISTCLVTGAIISSDNNAPEQKGGKTEALFNGKNLKNWVFYLRDSSVDPEKVFTVKNGVIHITGDPFGYMRTKKAYSDYTLKLEWRWPEEATNSGVFVHAQLPDTIWPRCIENQLKAGSAGDFVCMNGASMNEQTSKTARVVVKKNASNEKTPGEWNLMEVKCYGSTVEVYINGLLQNKATGTNISSGHICLQSEGKAIEFRNVAITRLK